MSKAALRRRTDADNPLERLTSEQRQDLFMRGLSVEVTQACDRWLRAHGIPPGALAGEYPSHRAQASPPQPQEQAEATGEAGCR